MTIIPAIDIKDGKCVRLTQGRMTDETVYSTVPWEMALRWESEGATVLHLVDLNGAVEGRGINDGAVIEIIKRAKMVTQLGGGIRNLSRITTLLSLGIDRVILGTIAVEQPELVQRALKRFGPEKIFVAVDAKNGKVMTRGWVQNGGISATDLGLRMKSLGVRRIIYTDTARDGMLTGPNIEETEHFAKETGLTITASGGVSSLDDLRALKPLEKVGVDSVIVGKALYEGKFGLREAIEIMSTNL